MATWVANDRSIRRWVSRSAQPNVVAVLDVDDLHQMNSRTGFDGRFAAALADMFDIAECHMARSGGIAARAGDEYCLVVSASHESQLRHAVEEVRTRGVHEGLTLSVGLARGGGLSAVTEAHHALMLAKTAGKDRLVDADW